MFNENLKALRKQKGYSQEELAIKLNVVRQTVSKWEKGLSVPDVEMLQSIADILEVNVSQLLDSQIPNEEEHGDLLAEQMAKIAEQMAIKNQRSGKIWKIIKRILIIILIIAIITTIMTICGLIGYSFIGRFNSSPTIQTEYSYILDDEIYTYYVTYDDHQKIISIDGPDDSRFHADKYEYLNDFDKALNQHLKEIGATFYKN